MVFNFVGVVFPKDVTKTGRSAYYLFQNKKGWLRGN
jgi:hypothetical protein